MPKLMLRLATLLLCSLSLQALALEPPQVQVSAEAEVQAMPDYLHITVQIEKTDKERSQAKHRVDVITQQVIDAARQAGVDNKHIDASQIFMQPEYRWSHDQREYLGEHVSRAINIKLYKLDKYSELANQIAKLDISRMQQQGVGFDNIEKYQNQALLLALEKAEHKARLIAKKVGKSVWTVQQVIEGGSQPVPVIQQRAVMMKSAAESSPAPLEIKPQAVHSSVSVIYLLE